MRTRAVNFRAPIVQALLAGRKSQFRTVLRQQPSPASDDSLQHGVSSRGATPYRAGDILWVRETWALSPAYDGCGLLWLPDDECLYFRADSPVRCHHPGCCNKKGHGQWRSSVHMPKWASRLTLKVTDVRVERLQQMNDEDAVAEGVWPAGHGENWNTEGQAGTSAREAFASYWDSITKNPNHHWDANPWVAVTTFADELRNIRE